MSTVATAPAGIAAVAGDKRAAITITVPSSNGGATITGYIVTGTPSTGSAVTATFTGLTGFVTGLTNGVTYTFTAVAVNAIGNSPASAASNTIMPSPLVWAAGANADETNGFVGDASNKAFSIIATPNGEYQLKSHITTRTPLSGSFGSLEACYEAAYQNLVDSGIPQEGTFVTP